MADFALFDGAVLEDLGTDASASIAAAFNSSGTPNAKGTWASLGTVSRESEGFWLFCQNRSGASVDGLVDVGFDVGGTKYVVLSNWLCSGGPTALNYNCVYVPVMLPGGAAMYARAQADSATRTFGVAILPASHGMYLPGGFGTIDTYGDDTSDSGGLALDAGASANSKGAYAQLVASTTRHCKAILVALGNGEATSRVAARFLVDVSIGAASSEKVIVPNLETRTGASGATEVPNPPYFGPFLVDVPAGTRLSARCQCSSTSTTDRGLDVAVYCFG